MEIDKKIVSDALQSILEHLGTDRYCCEDSNSAKILEKRYCQLLSRVWSQALEAAGAFTYLDSVVIAESAVAACIRAGIPRSEIKFSGNFCFYVPLPNMVYYIKKEISGFTAVPQMTIGVERTRRTVIGLTGDQFADFLFSFDRLVVPELLDAKERLRVAIEEQLLEWKKEKMVEQLNLTTAKALASQYLKPLGIKTFSCFISDGEINLRYSDGNGLHGRLRFPFERLVEELQDTEKILAELKPRERYFPHWFHPSKISIP